MRRKIFVILALVLSVGNVAVGLTYAATCRSSSGARACGEICSSLPNGNCACSGSCTKEERAWVAAGGGQVAEVEETNVN
jgi:hypothetical protein